MARHRWIAALVAGGLALAAVPPAAADSFPRLVPLETILPPPFVPGGDDPSGRGAGAGAGAGADPAALDGRVAAVRARAAALRDRPLIDAATRRRVEALRAR